MGHDPDEDRIRRKAHELWQAEGHPHGRDVDHWEQAREIVAIEDSYSSTLLPRDAGAVEPVESSALQEAGADVPGLTDQGEHDLTAVSREPLALSPPPVDRVSGEKKISVAESSSPEMAKALDNSASSEPANSMAKGSVPPDVSPKAGKSGLKKKK